MSTGTWKTADVRRYFRTQLAEKKFVIDRTGSLMLELIGASFDADEPAIFGTPNQQYIDKEIAWYDSMSTNIYDMPDPPAQWVATANKDGDINSNYGHLFYSHHNHNQYTHVLSELLSNPSSRRACAIYNRPSIWLDWDAGGKNDFICTNAVTYYIRDNFLHTVVQMRSNDTVYGYKNDRAWQCVAAQRLCDAINKHAESDIRVGRMTWQAQNLHVYERHFGLVT